MYTRKDLRVCVRLYGFWSCKLLGGKNCLFYAITEEEVFNVFSDGAKQLKKDS